MREEGYEFQACHISQIAFVHQRKIPPRSLSLLVPQSKVALPVCREEFSQMNSVMVEFLCKLNLFVQFGIAVLSMFGPVDYFDAGHEFH